VNPDWVTTSDGLMRERSANVGKLILVSNRVLSFKKAVQAGGLAVALGDVLKTDGGLWFGWDGTLRDEAARSCEINVAGSKAVTATTSLTPREHDRYYLGYANSVLWPVFHDRLDLAALDAGYYECYLEVNRRLARLLRPHIAADDVIWVHDYHLIPFAAALRDLGVKNRIGFFLHIPFPPEQIFQAVPQHAALAKALCAYDLIGLQTKADVGNLTSYLRNASLNGQIPAGRCVAIESFPVGINVEEFQQRTGSAAPSDSATIRAVGVDRLDYTKGLPQKLRGFERLLELYPEYRGRVSLTQIAPPTRESVNAYKAVKSELVKLVGAINGKYAELDWVPVNYINRAVARKSLAQVYRASKICLVTPLRDGLNLVAKEYVASQDPHDPGSLVLSQFAGAAEEMKEALIVNPYDTTQLAEAIKTAIEMPLEERKIRHQALLNRIVASDARAWCRNFLDRLTTPSTSAKTAVLGEQPPMMVTEQSLVTSARGLALPRTSGSHSSRRLLPNRPSASLP